MKILELGLLLIKVDPKDFIDSEAVHICEFYGYYFVLSGENKILEYLKAGIPPKLVSVKYEDDTLSNIELYTSLVEKYPHRSTDINLVIQDTCIIFA